MTELTQDLSLAQAHSLIDSYAFDLGSNDAEQLLQCWLDIYHANWIRLATIEALYLGRYKTISIEHILNVWLRLGAPNTHFTYEFERLICRKLPKHLSDLTDMTVNETSFPEISWESFNYYQTESKPESELATAPHEPSSRTKQNEVEQNSIAESEALSLEEAFKLEQAFKKVKKTPNNSFPKKVSIISAMGLTCKADWSEFTAGTKIIHQFIPLPDVSSFFNKLKTFGEEKLEGQ